MQSWLIRRGTPSCLRPLGDALAALLVQPFVEREEGVEFDVSLFSACSDNSDYQGNNADKPFHNQKLEKMEIKGYRRNNPK